MELEKLVLFIDTLKDSTLMSIHQQQSLPNTSSTTRLSRIKGFSSVSLILLVKKDFDQWPRPYYRGCHCAILAYDVANKDSFIDLSMWLVEVDACCDPVIKVLVGNKADKNDEREVSREEGESFARQHAFDFFLETSAKTGDQVENVFLDIAESLIKKYEGGLIPSENVPNSVIRPGSSQEVYVRKIGCC